MPNDQKFWLPVHEAGHAVVAIAAGVVPEFVRVYYGHKDGGETSLPVERTNDKEWELRFMAAGVAAEMMIYDLEKNTVPYQDMLDAAVDRSQEDRAAYRKAVDFAAMGIDPTSGPAINAKFFSFAIHKIQAIIKADKVRFDLFRQALEARNFVGHSAIRAIVQGKPPSQADIELDAKQEWHVINKVPYVKEPESRFANLITRLRSFF